MGGKLAKNTSIFVFHSDEAKTSIWLTSYYILLVRTIVFPSGFLYHYQTPPARTPSFIILPRAVPLYYILGTGGKVKSHILWQPLSRK